MVRDDPDGALLKVRAAPGASRDRVVGVLGDALKVAVRQPADRGRANDAIARVLADALGARPRDVTIARGATARDKWVRFAGWDAATLASKTRALLVTLSRR